MKPLNKSPHYLVRNPHSYCFRMNVPKDLQQLVGKKELRYSLKTGYISVARLKAQMTAAKVHQIFKVTLSLAFFVLSALPHLLTKFEEEMKDHVKLPKEPRHRYV